MPAQAKDRLTMTVAEAAKIVGVSRSVMYDAVAANQVPVVKLGRRLLIPRVALERFLAEVTV